jgi:6-phospho-beta-glucosidase
MPARISILGGSSPFTAALVDALADIRDRLPAATLVLHGRSTRAGTLVAAYACHRLQGDGWQVEFSADLDTALRGADIIVHQVRYGGLAGRAADEKLAFECGIAADETLGPAGLQAALRSAAEICQLGERIERLAPHAWVLNLTNPLSVATTLLAERLGSKCVGLCELPLYTVHEACRVLDVSPEDVRWNYAGLNHRGFVYGLTQEDTELLSRLASLPTSVTIGGIPAETILALGAVPLKYFRLMLGQQILVPGRAAELAELRDRILSELAEDARRSPPSLADREMLWYPLSVVPLMSSILRDDGREHVVNVLDGSLVREVPAKIGAGCPKPIDQPRPGPQVQLWIERFEEHESAVMEAVRQPSRQRIADAVGLDPLTPPGQVRQIADRISAQSAKEYVKS